MELKEIENGYSTNLDVYNVIRILNSISGVYTSDYEYTLEDGELIVGYAYTTTFEMKLEKIPVARIECSNGFVDCTNYNNILSKKFLNNSTLV